MSAMKMRKGETGVHPVTVDAWASSTPEEPRMVQHKDVRVDIIKGESNYKQGGITQRKSR